jgi:hypothetical protein
MGGEGPFDPQAMMAFQQQQQQQHMMMMMHQQQQSQGEVQKAVGWGAYTSCCYVLVEDRGGTEFIVDQRTGLCQLPLRH